MLGAFTIAESSRVVKTALKVNQEAALSSMILREPLATSSFVLSILEFIIIAHHTSIALLPIFTFFGNLSLFASYAMLTRPRNLKTAANKI